MKIITFILAPFLAAMAPADEIKDKTSGHIGLGALQCSVVISGFSVARNDEVRQWLFGYLAAIDADVFSLSQQEVDTRNESERAIALTIAKFIDGYCNGNPRSTVGDAMVDLHRNYDVEAWRRVLNALDKPIESP